MLLSCLLAFIVSNMKYPFDFNHFSFSHSIFFLLSMLSRFSLYLPFSVLCFNLAICVFPHFFLLELSKLFFFPLVLENLHVFLVIWYCLTTFAYSILFVFPFLFLSIFSVHNFYSLILQFTVTLILYCVLSATRQSSEFFITDIFFISSISIGFFYL